MESYHTQGLVFFTDLCRFGRITRSMAEEEQAAVLAEVGAITHRHVASAGGTLIKYISDSALGFFPEEAVDRGVEALLALKAEVESTVSIGQEPARIRVAAHFGPMYVTSYPPFDDQPDLLGEAVNIAVTLGEGGQTKHDGRFILSAPAFRSLAKETRRHFHKFTEPIVYLA